MSRGLRNCNPGNIRISNTKFSGEVISNDKSFKQFKNMAYGYRAMMKIIKYYYGHYNLKTVSEIINRWAPPIENNTSAYVMRVCKETGLNPTDEVYVDNECVLCSVVAAMSLVENGVRADMVEVKKGWGLL